MQAHSLKTVVLGTVFLAASLFGAQLAFAQTEGIQVGPAIIEDKVSPGQLYTFSIKVTNLSENERTFNLLARDISGLDSRGVPIFLEEGEPTPYELSSWVVLPQDSVTLKGNQSVNVPFTIQVPSEASPGSHFGGVFFEARPDQLQTTGAAVGSRVGTILNMRITGDITEDMRLREFSTEKFIYDAPPVTFTSKLDNLGNVLLRPHGLIEITDMFGKKVGAVEVNNSAAAVFPGSDREFTAVWEHDGFAVGRYQALMSFVYGEDSRKTVVRTTSFWIVPLKPLLIGFGIIFGLIIFSYGAIKMYIRKKLRDMGVSTRTDASLHSKKYTRPVSRVTFVVFGIMAFAVIVLFLLFFLFA